MPTSVSPASVSWWQSPPIIDPPSSMFGLGLTTQPFTAQCFGFTGMTIDYRARTCGSQKFNPLHLIYDIYAFGASTYDYPGKRIYGSNGDNELSLASHRRSARGGFYPLLK
jgi:hypothetical protein